MCSEYKEIEERVSQTSLHSMARSPQLVAFNKFVAIMQSSLEPDSITFPLCAAGIITRQDKEAINSKSNRDSKASSLISTILGHLELQPERFSQFLQAIDREPAYAAVTKQIRGNKTGICASISQ